jgi:alkanesulfonate monooxygenase SsuD/methylene tetrahydromethanopterin reductase-like flavin-dependent oxidoreductase (luciferase family)
VGTGWNWVEYDALGIPFEGRGERIEAQVELLRKLWSEKVVDHTDPYHRIERAGILHRPTRSIPIWFGGLGERPVKRAARMADGFTFGSANRFMLKLARLLRVELEARGREHEPFGVETIVGYGQGPDQWRRDLEAWQSVGVTHFSMRAMSTGASVTGEADPGFTTPRQHIDALEHFTKEVS